MAGHFVMGQEGARFCLRTLETWRQMEQAGLLGSVVAKDGG